MATIELNQVTKRFRNGTLAVRDMDLTITDGELVVLVGPSGCGKSTTLNMIAGLEDITSGELLINGERVNDVAPKNRDLAMVFQSYALYPHMTVRENIAFPLKMARAGRATIEARVADTARRLDLTDLLDRKPKTLSGGQQQRVAMGRAIIRQPRAFLMDEPMSNLDAKRRVQMQVELSRQQKSLGITTVYVTHDQAEAMRLGDRLVVLREGVVQQIGTPQMLYEHPAKLFVAGFIGSPAMNFLPAQLNGDAIQCSLGELSLSDRMRRSLEAASAPREVIMGVRPEQFEDAALVEHGAKDHGVTFTAWVDVLESIGSDKYAYLALGGEQTSTAELDKLAADADIDEVRNTGQLVTRLPAASAVTQGANIRIWLDPDRAQIFDPSDGRNLTRTSKQVVEAGMSRCGATAVRAASRAASEL